MDKVSLDIRVGDATRPMRFVVSQTGDMMIDSICEAFALAKREDFVLFLPPSATTTGKWLARGETLSKYLESTGLKSGGCLELRRTPHPVAVHLASERELVADEVLNSVHSTKRMVVDLSGTGADAMRDFQVLFAAAMKKSRDEYALCVYNQQPGEGSWKTEFISLNRTLWEQGLLPNGVVVLYPVSQILVASVKDSLSTAMFSGWLQPIKSDATAGPKKRSVTSRPAGSKKKPAFFVLRKNILFCFKSDAKAEKADYLILLDFYRTSKVEWDQGWVLRLDLKKEYPVQTAQNSVIQLHSNAESDIDLWIKSIAMLQREITDVYGVALHRVVNRMSNRNEYVPDYLILLVDELKSRIASSLERWRCLVDADAKPPLDLTKNVSSSKLPSLASHPDMAVASALRLYLLSLPAPVCRLDLLSLLVEANGDSEAAWNSLSSQAGDVLTASFVCAMRLFTVVPKEHWPKISLLWSSAMFGPSNCSEKEQILFEFVIDVLLEHEHVEQGATAPSHSETLTVLYSFEARNDKELSVTAGESVSLIRETNGWSIVSRSGAVGAVPTSYLSPPSSQAPSSSAMSFPSPKLSPKKIADASFLVSPRAAERATAEERLLLEFQAFELRALAAINEEKKAKAILSSKLDKLESMQ